MVWERQLRTIINLPLYQGFPHVFEEVGASSVEGPECPATLLAPLGADIVDMLAKLCHMNTEVSEVFFYFYKVFSTRCEIVGGVFLLLIFTISQHFKFQCC
jgi:hypothetical protein